MPIYVIGGQKGGTGKSTVATNLAVSLTRRGRSPLLVDADRQLTASHWSAERQSGTLTPITTVQKTGKLFRDLQALSERFEDVIVDAGGYDSVELRTALVAADHLYSPVKASQSDLWTLEAMSQLLGEARELNPRLGAHLLLSMAPTTRPAARRKTPSACSANTRRSTSAARSSASARPSRTPCGRAGESSSSRTGRPRSRSSHSPRRSWFMSAFNRPKPLRPEPPGLDAFAAAAAVTPVIHMVERAPAAAPVTVENIRGMNVRFTPEVKAALERLALRDRRSQQQILELVAFPAILAAAAQLG